MGFFKNLINRFFFRKKESLTISFSEKEIDIEENFIYRLKKREILIDSEEIREVDKIYVFFTELKFQEKYKIFEYIEIDDEGIDFYYPKNIKIKNYILNRLFFKEIDEKSLKSDEMELDKFFYIKPKDMDFKELEKVKWIDNIEELDGGRVVLKFEDDYTFFKRYKIVKHIDNEIIGKNKDEYILIELGKNRVKVGKKV